MPPVFIYNMPAVNPNNPSQGGQQRTTFRPPWVKEGPTPLPMPTAPWTARGREAAAAATPEEPKKIEKPGVRKLSKVTIIPSQPSQDNNAQENIGQASLKWSPKGPEKKQKTIVPISKPEPSIIIEKKQDHPKSFSKVKPPLVKEKEIFSQTNLKWTPKPKEGPGQSAAPIRRKESTTIPVVVESSKRKESTEKAVPVVIESKRKSSTEKAASSAALPSGPRERRKESVVQIKTEPEKEPTRAAREFAKPIPKPVEKELPKSILKDTSKTSVSTVPKAPPAPPAPPTPPMAPPPPPPPPPGKRDSIIKSEVTPVKAARLDALRSRPRRRPDWVDMMKEVERGKQLRHVQCNDRSAPILPKEKAKGQFIYDSEKETTHSPHKQLLNQIQHGVKLKTVRTNDRSRPNLDGLRKFRRQMTIEEQIQKSMSMADVVAAAAEPDELDDIDKVRDDLQSTKQMLAQELRNKEALERENKRIMARLLNLEVELEKEKNTKKTDVERGTLARSVADEKLVNQLKEEASEANRVSKEMEDKYHGTAEELDATRAKLESAWLRNQQLELELKSRGGIPITKQPSSKKLAASVASMPNGKAIPISDDESEYTEETETESESEEEGNEADAVAVQERRIARELKLLATKLRSYKEKQAMALKESRSLREQLRKQQKILRQEKKKYKALQKEVDKMARLMKDDEEEEEEQTPEEEEDEEEETESESDSEESEEEELTDGDLPDDTSVDDKRKNLIDRSKHHENRLGTLKKGNYLLKANIDRLQDDINRQREMSLSLQEDLNSVLAELG